MLLTCNKSERKCTCVRLCVCVYELFEDQKSLSIGYCYWMIPPPQPTRGSFSDRTRATQTYLGLFPLAGITVPGVIVHLLCISVILPSCDDRYIFYKDIHIVCVLLCACWLPMCCCVNTLNLRQWYLGHFWGSWNKVFIFIFLCVLLNFIGWWWAVTVCVFPPFSFKSVLIITAGCPSALPQNVARYRGPNRANYMEACHIKTNSKQPDASGYFLMVFSIFNHFGLHFFSLFFYSYIFKMPYNTWEQQLHIKAN